MFSTNLKRSAATLGVVAGLLAAAGPASAQIAPGTVGVTMPHNHESALITEITIPGLSGPKAPRANSSEIAVERLTQVRKLNDVEGIDFDALGTQVGSEGVKAPANADEQMKDDVKAVVVLIGANDYGFAAEAEGTQVASEGVKAPTNAPAPIDSGPGDDNIV